MKDMAKRSCNTLKLTSLLLVIFVAGSGCRTEPATVDTAERFQGVFAGAADVFIIREDNSLWGAGSNHAGQLGLGQATRRELLADGAQGGEPFSGRIYDDTGAPFSGVRYIAAGEGHSVILRNDGSLWGAGDSSFGELGLDGGSLSTFTRLSADGAPISGVSAVSAGNNSSFFISGDNSLWAAGFNNSGELGLGNQDIQFSFTRVESAGLNVRAIASGMRHTVLLMNDGTVWVAGNNLNGQLGLGDTEDRAYFTELRDAGSGIIAVAAGNYHTVILGNDGSVWAAGSNFWGQLGQPDPGNSLTLTRLNDANGNPITNVRQIAARGDMTLLLTAAGSLLLAGNYTDPQAMQDMVLGDTVPAASPAFAPLPVEQGAAANLGEIQKIALGYTSIYVIDSNGRLWAAGSNRYGQLMLAFDTEISPALTLVNP